LYSPTSTPNTFFQSQFSLIRPQSYVQYIEQQCPFLQTNYLSTLFLQNSYTIKIKAVPLQQQNPPRFP
ncbi:MAG: hypothetical protein SOW10_01530, partial [Alloprevotella sp.]|nr:hypothetical protein [Alloprevotella sp.]